MGKCTLKAGELPWIIWQKTQSSWRLEVLDEQFDVDTMWVLRESKREGQRCAHSTAKRRRRASKSMIFGVPSIASIQREGENKEGKQIWLWIAGFFNHPFEFFGPKMGICPSIFLKLCSPSLSKSSFVRLGKSTVVQDPCWKNKINDCRKLIYVINRKEKGLRCAIWI